VTDLVEEVEGRARIADAQPRRLSLPHPYSHPHTHRGSSLLSVLPGTSTSLWWSTSLPPLPLSTGPVLRFSWTILLQLPEQRTMPGTSTSSIVAPEPSDLQGQPDSPGGAQKRKRDDGAALASHPPEFAVPLPPMTAALLSRSPAPDGSAIAQPPPGSQPRVEVVDYPGAGERGQRSSDTDGGSSSGAASSGDNAPSSSNPLTALPLTGCLTE
jgi:hypothetical protein